MTNDDFKQSGISIPARVIPTPLTVSAEAQVYLSRPLLVRTPEPDPNDKAAWRSYIQKSDHDLSAFIAAASANYPARVTSHSLANVTCYEITPATYSAKYKSQVIFYLHGGGFTIGGGYAAAQMAMPLAHKTQMRTFSVDYRMPPDHPFPAGLNDAVEAYASLLRRFMPDQIVAYGASAGAGLAASFVLKARDLGMPMPAACVLHSPELDLTESGDTFETNDKVDVMLSRLTNSIALYADGHDLTDPYLSPIFGDFKKGYPATILSSGTRDLFLSNTVRMHRALRRAGTKTELHIWEAMPHGGFMATAPEDEEVYVEHIRFIREQLKTNENNQK